MSRSDLLSYIKNNINPKLVADYQLVEALFSSASLQSHGAGSGLGPISSPLNPGVSGSTPVSFGRAQGAYMRGKELNRSQDKFLRISWYTHSQTNSTHTHSTHTHTLEHTHTNTYGHIAHKLYTHTEYTDLTPQIAHTWCTHMHK